HRLDDAAPGDEFDREVTDVEQGLGGHRGISTWWLSPPGLTRLRGRSPFGAAKARRSIALGKTFCEAG
ncbi:hypothetical protein, partial [Rhodopseudomonas sp. BR0C11]|uniref:hypothetical protein n=1 Tax=Rhodopseudomonas sp. BR0C11 TaxID=2269370 RepID=UPI001968400A